jgi:hypothetical protein
LGSIFLAIISGYFFGSIFSSIFYSAGSSNKCIHCSEVAPKSPRRNGRLGGEMEELKEKWKSQRRKGRRVEGVKQQSAGEGVEVELVKCNTWIG